MGATQVFTKESYLTDPMQKSDFPKLKTSEPSKDRDEIFAEEKSVPLKREEAQPNKIIPIFVWITAIMLLAQLILFFATFYIVRNSRNVTSPHLIAQKQTMAESLPVEGARSNQEPALIAAKQTLIPLAGTITDFDNSALKTIFDTPIYVGEDGVSKQTLKLSLDDQNGMGRKGKALRINYTFQAADSQKADCVFELPQADISSIKKLRFHLRLGPSEEEAPQVSVLLIGLNGKQVSYLIGETFSFWKEYELNMGRSEKEVLGGVVTSIVFRFTNAAKKIQGVIFLDNLSLT